MSMKASLVDRTLQPLYLWAEGLQLDDELHTEDSIFEVDKDGQTTFLTSR